jgi:hypothetical protein
MKEKPMRIQRKRAKGWRMPENTVYVGRGSVWGNPFKGADAYDKYASITDTTQILHDYELRSWIRAGGREDALWALRGDTYRRLRMGFHLLRGKNLACWCPIGAKCHADILLGIINNKQ